MSTIAITGGAGCIGGAIADQCHAMGHAVTIIDRNEQALFWSQQRRPWARHVVRDVASSTERIEAEVVYHAAAYKHVPLMEGEPWQAILNNVVGTRNVVQAATGRVVLVSTDKACGPSLMGRTKWLAERVTLAAGHSAIRLVNVLRSPGSVLDIWEQQAARGEPLTMTDPAAERYWMTAEEAALACAFVGCEDIPAGLYAWLPSRPMTVGELADREHPGAERVVVGMRPGEATSEKLCGDGERMEATKWERIGRVYHAV